MLQQSTYEHFMATGVVSTNFARCQRLYCRKFVCSSFFIIFLLFLIFAIVITALANFCFLSLLILYHHISSVFRWMEYMSMYEFLCESKCRWQLNFFVSVRQFIPSSWCRFYYFICWRIVFEIFPSVPCG